MFQGAAECVESTGVLPAKGAWCFALLLILSPLPPGAYCVLYAVAVLVLHYALYREVARPWNLTASSL